MNTLFWDGLAMVDLRIKFELWSASFARAKRANSDRKFRKRADLGQSYQQYRRLIEHTRINTIVFHLPL